MRLSPLAQVLSLSTMVLLLTACNDNNDSDNTPVIRDVTPPLLTINSDFDDSTTAVAASFISGQVQDTGGIKSLTYGVNDNPIQTLSLDADGNFTDTILLALGDNQVTLTATDNADNITTSTKTLYLGDTIAAGGSHTGALRDGHLYSWGRNNYGQTGLGSVTKLSENNNSVIPLHPNTPFMMSNTPIDLISIGFNQNHSLAIAQDGRVYSWGEDKSGQLGRGDLGRDNCSSTEDCRLDIGAIANIENAVMVAPGYSHNLVLTQDGTVWAMGANGQGQLGNAAITSSSSSIPVKVDFSSATDIGHIVQVAVSSGSSYALDDKGQVWGWGSDDYANLGKGIACTTANNCINENPVPVRITVITDTATDEKVTQLAAGRDHVLALTNKESVYGWGLNSSSQVGYNGQQFKDTENAWDKTITAPTKLPWFADKKVKRVYANGNSSYVLLNNGKVYLWGMFGETNSEGRTIYNNLDEPTDNLPSLTDIENIGMGALHLIAQDKSDHLYTWGWSFEGSIGSKLATNIWMYNVPFSISLPTQSAVN